VRPDIKVKRQKREKFVQFKFSVSCLSVFVNTKKFHV
jgi:hypothetical protein